VGPVFVVEAEEGRVHPTVEPIRSADTLSFLHAVGSHWDRALVIVRPQTVVGWHRGWLPAVLALEIPRRERQAFN